MIKRTVLFCLFWLCFFSVTAAAQSSVYPRSEVYGGLSALLGSGGAGTGGGTFSYTKYRNRYFGWEVNGAFFNERQTTGFRGNSRFLLAGPRYVERGEWKTYHWHALAGIVHYDAIVIESFFPVGHRSGTAFAWQVGGGMDFNFTDRWGWRMVQLDFIKVYPPNPVSFGSGIKFSVITGFVFKWGDVEN